MGLRFLGIMVAYVLLAIGVYQFWPQADAVDTPAKNSASTSVAQPAVNQSARPETTASTTDVAAPAQAIDVATLQADDQNDFTQLSGETLSRSSESRLVTADRMQVLRTWTMVEECRLNKCESLDFSEYTLSWLPDEVRDLRRVSQIKVGPRMSDINALNGLSNIRHLVLTNGVVEDLSALSTMRGLKTIELNGARTANIAPLKGLAALEDLIAPDTKVRNLAPVSEMFSLQNLDVSNTDVIDLAPLKDLFQLQSLKLSNSKIMDLSNISGLSNLSDLDVSGTNLRILPDMSENTALKKINLKGTQIVELSALADVIGLEELNVSDTPVVSLDGLKDLPNLREVDLRNTQIENLNVLDLAPNLELVLLNDASRLDDEMRETLLSRGVNLQPDACANGGSQGASLIRFATNPQTQGVLIVRLTCAPGQ